MVVCYVREQCGRALCYREVWSCAMLERSVVVSYVREQCGRVLC